MVLGSQVDFSTAGDSSRDIFPGYEQPADVRQEF
jgi:hypothetical protein